MVWNKEQEAYLINNYNGNGSSLCKVLPFSSSAIRNKAMKLGLKNQKHFHNVIKTELPKLSEFDLGYIAAFLDGEGSITYSKSASTQISYRVKIANSDQGVIFWLRETLGIGKIRIWKARKKQHLDSFEFILERQGDVWGFLEMIHPYLKVKQLKAIKILHELKEKHEKGSVST